MLHDLISMIFWNKDAIRIGGCQGLRSGERNDDEEVTEENSGSTEVR